MKTKISPFFRNYGSTVPDNNDSVSPLVAINMSRYRMKEKESEILSYMRDMLKIPDFTAFDLINKWRKEMNPVKEAPKIDLSQFRG